MKWIVEFCGNVDVEAETEEAAVRAAFAALQEYGADNILFADADPIFSADATGASPPAAPPDVARKPVASAPPGHRA
jgi:hypothetical protein